MKNDLVTIEEAAANIVDPPVNRSTFWRWAAKDPAFPANVDRHHFRKYKRAEVIAWLRSTGRGVQL